jgi:hypothetical protein
MRAFADARLDESGYRRRELGQVAVRVAGIGRFDRRMDGQAESRAA